MKGIFGFSKTFAALREGLEWQSLSLAGCPPLPTPVYGSRYLPDDFDLPALKEIMEGGVFVIEERCAEVDDEGHIPGTLWAQPPGEQGISRAKGHALDATSREGYVLFDQNGHVIPARKKKPKSKTAMKRLYDVEEAAIYLGRTVWAVREMMYRGKLPYVEDGRRKLFDVRDLDEWIERNKTRSVC
jgi:excisionase family DNA binding protein